MTNKNVSGLTAATTPLAGTELVPVWDGAGTKKVSVDNLTAGKDVAVKNLGVGGLPNAWYSGWKAVQGKSGSFAVASNTTGMYLVENAYLNAVANWVYTDTAPATFTQSYLGVINWHNAPAGAAVGDVVSFTKRMSLSLAGDLTNNTGNYVQGTTAKGVNFTANTPAAGMTSQLLNWYEEGTWTPTLLFGGGNNCLYTTRTGDYTRVGRQVTLTCTLVLSAVGASTGVATVSGFPFTSKAGVPTVSIFQGDSVTFTGSFPLLYQAGGGTDCTLYGGSNAATYTPLTHANFANTSTLRFVLTFNT